MYGYKSAAEGYSAEHLLGRFAEENVRHRTAFLLSSVWMSCGVRAGGVVRAQQWVGCNRPTGETPLRENSACEVNETESAGSEMPISTTAALEERALMRGEGDNIELHPSSKLSRRALHQNKEYEVLRV